MKKSKSNPNHIQELKALGVKQHVAYARYFNKSNGCTLEAFHWDNDAILCNNNITKVNKRIVSGIENDFFKKHDKKVMHALKISDINQLTAEMLQYIHFVMNNITPGLKQHNTIILVTTVDGMHECYAVDAWQLAATN